MMIDDSKNTHLQIDTKDCDELIMNLVLYALSRNI